MAGATNSQHRNFGTGSQPARPVYIVDGARTPFLKARGKPGPFPAAELAVGCGRQLLTRQTFDPSAIDEVIVGCVMPGPDEANIARVLALRLGIGNDVPAYTVQRNCASGMQALDNAAMEIAANRAHLILAGGVESMSHCPVLYNNEMVNWLAALAGAKSLGQRLRVFSQLRLKHFKPIIGLLRGLTDPVVGLSMGQTAENLAYRFNISRQQMDEFAVRSHQRLAAAQDQGHLNEIEPLYDYSGKFYDNDDGLRRDSSVEALGKLKPVFDRPFGAVTAGNSAQVTDGSALLLLASEHAVQEYKLPVIGQIKDSQWSGLEPAQMGLGPVHAITPILQRQQFQLKDVDYWEINEAFAAQVLGCLAAWEDDDYCKNELGLDTTLGTLDQQRLNVDGGGVSIGHPVGASGARIVLHVLDVLKRNNAKRGIASLCIGGGQGGAMLVERV
ncbi:MAG: acetyl-CoA C-acetyltransferase [Gammaproteobacteria bacterium]|nr:acetyl-CoA C-acetyltransferase [Gammaproteobacteria bacterium]